MNRLLNHRDSNNTNTSSAFTIIELLIVIVIIGILVAIVAVSYNGITKSAKEASLKSDLKQASTQLELDKTKSANNQYPNTISSLKSSNGANLEISTSNNGTNYCLSATASPDLAFHITNTNTNPQEGVCSGHTPPQDNNTGTEIPNSTPIQNITKAQCDALPIYNGTNTSAIRTVTDNRDGTTRTYEIAKLADNNCWMLTNLKLGSTTQAITLTPQNTNIATDFALPQVKTTGSASSSGADNGIDTPYAYGPVPGDTGLGQTNYGYLYNWPAATAGETQTTMPVGSGNAPNSICPKNWRLPTGGGTGEFAMLNAKMNNPGTAMPSTQSGTGYYQNWQYIGPFKGVLAGSWSNGFYNHSAWGYSWSSSANTNTSKYAFNAGFDAAYVYPSSSNDRYSGFAVRCLLN